MLNRVIVSVQTSLVKVLIIWRNVICTYCSHPQTLESAPVCFHLAVIVPGAARLDAKEADAEEGDWQEGRQEIQAHDSG